MGRMSEPAVDVLLVEDNPGDVRLVEEALQGTPSTLHVTNDGGDALDFLYRRGEFADAPRPDVVLLDLNLPHVDGFEVLEEIRDEPRLDGLRVVIVTSARREDTTIDLDALDETGFLTKPADPGEFMASIRSVVFD